jgi:hypothetical protein
MFLRREFNSQTIGNYLLQSNKANSFLINFPNRFKLTILYLVVSNKLEYTN